MAGTSDTPETFRLAIAYTDGTVQVLLLFIHDFAPFMAAVEASGIGYQIDPSTGVIQPVDGSGLPL